MLRQEDYNTSKASSQKSTCLRNSKINVFRNNPVLAIIWCNLLIMTLFLCISRTITTAGETFVHQIHHEWFNYSIQPYQRTTCCRFLQHSVTQNQLLCSVCTRPAANTLQPLWRDDLWTSCVGMCGVYHVALIYGQLQTSGAALKRAFWWLQIAILLFLHTRLSSDPDY